MDRILNIFGRIGFFLGAILFAAGPPSAGRAAEIAAVAPVMSCEALLGLDLTGLEGAPARIETATEVRENTPRPYCAVTGYAAPAVRFEVRLPLQGWTQRFLMLGCGGFCLSLIHI